MSRASPRFTKADVTRALKGAVEAGFDASTVEIMPDGVIRMSRGEAAAAPEPSPFDVWKAKKDAH